MWYGIITYSLFGKTYMLNMLKTSYVYKNWHKEYFLFNLMNIISFQ